MKKLLDSRLFDVSVGALIAAICTLLGIYLTNHLEKTKHDGTLLFSVSAPLLISKQHDTLSAFEVIILNNGSEILSDIEIEFENDKFNLDKTSPEFSNNVRKNSSKSATIFTFSRLDKSKDIRVVFFLKGTNVGSSTKEGLSQVKVRSNKNIGAYVQNIEPFLSK